MFFNVPIAKRLSGGIGVVVLAFVVLVIFVMSAFTREHDTSELIHTNFIPATSLLYSADRDLQQALVAERTMLATDLGSVDFQNLLSDHIENIQQARDRVDKFYSLLPDERVSVLMADYTKLRDAWESGSAEIVLLAQSNQTNSRDRARQLSITSGAENFEAMRDVIDKMQDYLEEVLDKKHVDAKESFELTLMTLIGSVIFVVVLAVYFSYLLLISITNPVNRVVNAIQAVERSGSFQNKVNYQNNDEIGLMALAFDGFLESLSTMFSETNQVLKAVNEGDYKAAIKGRYNGDMATLCKGVNDAVVAIHSASEEQLQQQKQIEAASQVATEKAKEAEVAAEEARKVATEANRVQQALDVTSTSVMMADVENKIVYANDALNNMMNKVEWDIRQSLPQFNAQRLLGENMDIFYQQPSHQRSLVSGLQDSFSNEIKMGGRTFSLTLNPITDNGKRIGTVVEWQDRTDEVLIESEIDSMIAAAASGDFSVRLDTQDKEGFFRLLANGLNNLVASTNDVMAEVGEVIHDMSKGDLTRKIETDYRGTFGELKENVNSTMDKLVEVVANITAAAGHVKQASREIEAGMRDLSSRTEEQAASLEETASSMNQMTETVQNSSENTATADAKAKNAESKALAGGDVVKQAVVAMESINQASSKIADIIGVIDEIAFQTNLLALNAAVEAARAGDQGRGFAVVASEVRQLAQRSSNAAKEIKELINDSVDKVSVGSNLVNRSGANLSEIVEAVESVGEIIAGLANAAKEQAMGIGQVNVAISQMDEMTQQNSALVEQATAAGENIANQSIAMADAVSFFKVHRC